MYAALISADDPSLSRALTFAPRFRSNLTNGNRPEDAAYISAVPPSSSSRVLMFAPEFSNALTRFKFPFPAALWMGAILYAFIYFSVPPDNF
jgi:hypothetical protein